MELLPSRSNTVKPLITSTFCSWLPIIVVIETFESTPSMLSSCRRSSVMNVLVLQFQAPHML